MGKAVTCALHRPPRCPKCHWSLAFHAVTEALPWPHAEWCAWCWNPGCERDEVRPDEILGALVERLIERTGDPDGLDWEHLRTQD